MSKQKTGTAKSATMVLKAKSESIGCLMTTPTNREQRRDLQRAKRKEAKEC
jgi:hypothetical protein